MPKRESDDKRQQPQKLIDAEALIEIFDTLDKLRDKYFGETRRHSERLMKIEAKYRDEALEAEFQHKLDNIDAELVAAKTSYDTQLKIAMGNEQLIEAAKQEYAKKEDAIIKKRSDLQKAFNTYQANVQKQVLALEEKITRIKTDNDRKSKTVLERESEYRKEAIDCNKTLVGLNNAKLAIEESREEIALSISDIESRLAVATDSDEKDRLKSELSIQEIKQKELDTLEESILIEEESAKKRKEHAEAESKRAEEILRTMRGAAAVEFYESREADVSEQLDDKKMRQAEMSAEKSILERELSSRKEEAEKLGVEVDTSDLEERINELVDAMNANGEDILDLNNQLNYYAVAQIEAREVKNPAESAMEKFNSLIKSNAELRKEKEQRKADKDAKQAFKEMLKDNYWTGDGTSNGGQGDMQRALNENALLEIGKSLEEAFGGDNLKKQLAAGMSKFNDSIDQNISTFYKYQATVTARLQGSDETYQKVVKKMSGQLIANPFVKQSDMIENIKEAVDLGIAYNLDLRSFLATVSDNIANTFDAFDATLLKMVRLQQADTTAARLGMEASLTKLFNQYFSDTSYLKDVAKDIRSSLLEATSMMSYEAGLEFEYMVQKWLGALYSVGFSSETVSKIAQGINYLGTGNVEALNGDDQLNTLMAMSASKAGLSYGDILLNGLNAKETNMLLKSMVEYLASIAQSSDNSNVTKSAYTNIFGMNMSDMRALMNLSSIDLSNISSEVLNYSGAINELNSQFSQVGSRIHMSQWVENMIDNASIAAAVGIGDNIALYGMWKALGIVEGLTGGIHIPAFSVFGNMVDLSQFTIEGIAKTGIAGLGMLGGLLGALGNGGGLNPFSLDAWGFDQTTSRGSKIKGLTSGSKSGFSESNQMNMTTSSSGSDVKNTGMSDKTDEAGEDSKTTNKDVSDEGDIYEKIYSAIADDKTSVLQEVIKLNDAIPSIAAEIVKISTASSAIQELLKLERIFKTAGEPSTTLLAKLDAIASGTDSIRVALVSMASAGVTPVGSHADGLDVVPYDGYIAELHAGEAVLTKEQAQLWRDDSLSDEQNKFIMQTAQTFQTLTVNPVNETIVELPDNTDITAKILTEIVNLLGIATSIRDTLYLVDIQKALNASIDANYKTVEKTTTDVTNFIGSATNLIEVISKLKEEDKVVKAVQLVTGDFYNNLVQPIDNISKLYTVISSQMLTDKSIVVTPINEVYVTVPEVTIPEIVIPDIVVPPAEVTVNIPDIMVPKSEIEVSVPDVIVSSIPQEVNVVVDDINDVDLKVLNEIISLTGIASSIKELIGNQSVTSERLIKRGEASDTTVVTSIREFDGVITGFSSVVDNQSSTVESISHLSAVNAATMMSVGQTNKELQRELQEESRRKELTVNSTKIGSVTEAQTVVGATNYQGAKQNGSGVIESLGITPEEFVKLLVDRLGGLEVKVTDMPGSDSTTPLYTIGGGTP